MAKKPVLLMFHPGGFIFQGQPMDQAMQAARQRGFRPRVVDYQLGNVPAAVKQSARLAKRLQRKGRTTYAYGESAGGTLASLLAQRGLVKGAAVQAPVSNIRQWMASTGNDPDQLGQALHVNRRQARKFSPNKNRTRSPILAEAPVDDPISTPTLPWANKAPGVKGVSVPGQHLDPAYYGQNVNRAMKYLAVRRRLDRRGRTQTKY